MAGIDSFTKLILHMDGADASTTFTDSSSSPKTFTARNSAQIDTAQSKFGGASGLFARLTSDYIDTGDSTDFTLGSSDFTFDGWFRIAGNAGQFRHISGQNDAAFTLTTVAHNIFINTSNFLQARCYSSSTAYSITTTTAPSVDTWYHFAFVRNGNNLNLYLDGTAEGGTVDVTGVSFNDSANAFSIGRTGALNANYFDGWIDEYRFSLGVARWTANFTPPTEAYSEDVAAAATVLNNKLSLRTGAGF